MYAQTGQYFSSAWSKKAILEKKRKKKGIESPGDTDGPCATAKLRNSFSIRSRPRREKEDSVLHSVDEIHRSTGPDRSFFRPLFLYILSNSFPSLVLFSSSSFLLFFRNRSRAVGKKEKIGYADTWRLKGNEKWRERERSDFIILLFILRGSSPPRPISRVYIQPLLPPPINSLFRQFLLWKTVIELDSVINNSPIVLLN